MNPALWVAAAGVSLRMAAANSVVHGVIRAADSGEPISAASLVIATANITTWSDSAGTYRMELAAPGTYRVLVSRLGYRPRSVDLVVDGAMTLVVDIALIPEPVQLVRVAVVGRPKDENSRTSEPDLQFDAGSRRLAGDALHANPALDEPDALAVLSTTAAVTTMPGLPTSLHVRGGAGDQNLVMIDGIPIFNPYHVGGTLSAMGADVISSVTLDAGAASAQYGGALSSVVNLRTVDVRPQRFSAWGGIGASGIRQSISTPLPWADAWLLVSGRRSLGDIYSAVQGQGPSAGFSDIFGKATLRLGPGTLEIFSFGSGDQLGFDSRLDQQTLGGTADATRAAASNVFRSSSSTQAAVWSVGDSGSFAAVLRGWYSSTRSGAAWASTPGSLILANDLSGSGLGARLAWAAGTTRFTAGVDLERFRSSYSLRPAAGSVESTNAAFALASDTPMLSIFGEGRWRLTDRWSMRIGLRAPLGAGWALDPEPRLVLSFAASPRVTLAAGYARMQQFRQSLRNDESLIDGLFGIALPVTAAADGTPVARSDQLTASIHASLDHGIAVTVDGYVRRLSGLLLVAPATGQPFATTGFAVGTGQASGLGVSATRFGALWSATADYSLGASTRLAGTQRYRPGYDISQQFSLAAAWEVAKGTTVRAAMWGMVGRPGTVAYGNFQWSPASIALGGGDVAGSPQQFVGPVGGAQLAAYWQVDVGIRHRWQHPRLLPMFGEVTASLSIDNVFNRGNVLGRAERPGAPARYDITLPPRTVVVGLSWAY